jgi:hypothetical protein
MTELPSSNLLSIPVSPSDEKPMLAQARVHRLTTVQHPKSLPLAMSNSQLLTWVDINKVHNLAIY